MKARGNMILVVFLIFWDPGVLSLDEVVQNCDLGGGKRGVCVGFEHRLRNCPPLLKLLRERKFAQLQSAVCDGFATETQHFDLTWVKVCCPVEELVNTPDEPEFEHHPNFRLLPRPDNSVCGQTATSDRIIGGDDALPGEFPWMAKVAIKHDDDTEEFTCGASIISERYVLSAAHCFKDKGAVLSKVRVGDTYDDSELECITFGNSTICEKEQDLGVEELIMHPEYTGDTGSQHDIALIRLKGTIQNMSSYEFHIPALQIQSTGASSIPAIVAGWGKLHNSDTEGSPDLQYLAVPVTDRVQCGHVYKSSNVTITEHQICAGGVKGQGSCAGDSGGPLFYPAKPKGKSTMRNFQIGIVSFGKYQCATANAPVVYTRVRKYLSWILDNIKE